MCGAGKRGQCPCGGREGKGPVEDKRRTVGGPENWREKRKAKKKERARDEEKKKMMGSRGDMKDGTDPLGRWLVVV